MRLRREKEVDPLDALPKEVWARPRPLHGVRFDRAGQARRLDALRPRIKEFPPVRDFRMWNESYESVDAEILWAILRELRPSSVVQVGESTWSSLIVAAALEANGDGAEHVRHAGHPRDLDDGVIEALGARDVLFVDSSHEVRTGSDVTALVLDVLPRLERGVVVHFHDVLLPWEDRRGYTEQDLLQAFLTGNDGWEVLLGVHDLTRTEPELVRRLVPSWRGDTKPSAFWLRRC